MPRSLQQRILRADPTLDPPAPVLAGRDRRRVPAQLPADITGFRGRAGELAGLDALLCESTAAVISALSGTASA